MPGKGLGLAGGGPFALPVTGFELGRGFLSSILAERAAFFSTSELVPLKLFVREEEEESDKVCSVLDLKSRDELNSSVATVALRSLCTIGRGWGGTLGGRTLVSTLGWRRRRREGGREGRKRERQRER